MSNPTIGGNFRCEQCGLWCDGSVHFCEATPPPTTTAAAKRLADVLIDNVYDWMKPGLSEEKAKEFLASIISRHTAGDVTEFARGAAACLSILRSTLSSPLTDNSKFGYYDAVLTKIDALIPSAPAAGDVTDGHDHGGVVSPDCDLCKATLLEAMGKSKQAGDVEAALVELREMFPRGACSIEHVYRSGFGTPEPDEDDPIKVYECRWTVWVATMSRGKGATLPEAMTKVREWKAGEASNGRT